MKLSISARKPSKVSLILVFSLIIFFITFADAMMSYISPIFIEEQVSNTFMMGLIFSFSSMVGLMCDFLFPSWFKGKPHFFFLKITILVALAFPFTMMFVPQHVLTLLIAMAIWGVYYELNNFSFFEFVHTYVHVEEHAKTWGVLTIFQSLAFILAPLLAAQLLLSSYDLAFTTVLMMLGFAVFGSIIFRLVYVNKHPQKVHDEKPVKKSWIKEFRVWGVLLKKVWPLYILQMVIYSVEASFWTIGPIFSQTLKGESIFGGFFLTAYMFPPLFLSLLAGKAAVPFGKKRMALLTSIGGGLALFSFLFANSAVFLIGITFLVSSFLAIALPEIKATFEDYVSRLGDHGKDMIGIQSSSNSIAYILGPIVSSLLATIFDIKTAFSIMGLILFLISFLLFFITPRKIKMPQGALSKL